LTLTAQPIAPCAAAISDNVLITFQRPPSADAGADRDTCGGAAVQLNGGASHYAGVAWTTDGDGTFNPDPATVLNPTYAPGEGDIAAGSVTLTLTATAVAPCDAEAADDMVLTIAAGPTSDAGPDQGLCYAQGQTPQVALNGSATEYSSVLWTTSGTGFFNNNTILNPVYTPSAADVASGNVTLTLTANPIAPCTSPAQNDMVATFQIEPTVEAGESQSICGQQPVSVSGTAAAFSSVQWTTSGTGSFADPDSLTTVYTPGTEDVDAGSVILTLTANPIAPCADAVSDDLTVTIQDSGVIAGDLEPSADQRVCPNDSAFFRVPVEGVPADYTYTWQFDADRDGVFETTLVDDGVITGTGTYTITINPASDIHEGLYRCIVDSACPGETSNTASLRVNPTIGDVTVDPADGNPCEDDVVIFAAIDVQAKPGVQIFYQWRLGGTAIPGAQSDTLVLDPVTLGDAGDYTVRVTTSCGGEVISDPITLTVAPAPTAEAGNPQTICADASASLSGASATDYAAVLWTRPVPMTSQPAVWS
jgi:hypothetical protein